LTMGGPPLHRDWASPGLTLNGGILAIRGRGYGDFSGLSQNAGDLDSRHGGIRIPTRAPGAPCNAHGIQAGMSGGNIALHQDTKGIYVMVCRNGPGTSDGVWVRAMAG
ncbi:hypothetical protein, partial [Roseateles sp.]|uniref:hypothetical protein n=1 Tax=Roseateles sp. TaxID=1971397 RepID=UPI002F3FDB39